MPFSAEQLSYAGRHALDFYLKNDPIDQINIAHPLAKKLMDEKTEFSGGLQYVVEQLRYQNDSNAQPYFGGGQVTYNQKRTLQQSKYPWCNIHDGFSLDEDELKQNGIRISEGRNPEPSDNEKVQLSNLLKENLETLKLGKQEYLDRVFHRDGTQSSLEVPGLDALISLSPTAGTVGTIAASNAWWQNYANAAVNATAAEGLEDLEVGWQACILRGGSAPNFIIAGQTFINWYRGATTQVVSRQVNVGGSEGTKKGTVLDASVGNGISTGLYFKGIEILWDPMFEQLDTLDAPTVTWSERCYFINTKHLKLRPISGSWMIARRPPRVYDRYVYYWALTSSFAVTTNKRNAHAVFALA